MTTQRTYSEEEVEKRFDSLSQDIKDAIYSVETEQTLTSIGNKYHLHVDQLSSLEAEVNAIVLGFTEPEDFQEILRERLEVDDAIAKGIVEDLNAKLFGKIREYLKQPFIEQAPVTQVRDMMPKVEVTPIVRKPLPASTASLNQTTSITPKKVEVSLPEEKKGSTFKADPYREPID